MTPYLFFTFVHPTDVWGHRSMSPVAPQRYVACWFGIYPRMPEAKTTSEQAMDDRVEAIALGAGWVRHLTAEAGQALRDFPVWIGLGTVLTFAMVLTMPLLPGGMAAFTCAMVTMLGTLSWAVRPDPASNFPFRARMGRSGALSLA